MSQIIVNQVKIIGNGNFIDQTKILIIAANPWDTQCISPDEEYREIKEVLSKSMQDDNFVLEYAPASSDAELRQALLDFKPNMNSSFINVLNV
jgi:hypothetical protein